ncbi:paraquat-inducible protein A [Fragilaria crotonensis]|nr:paraquat-inducible protein A [Fragilaria crotonensis]
MQTNTTNTAMESPDDEQVIAVEEENSVQETAQGDEELKYPAHVWNPDIDRRWRYGIPIVIMANFGFLLAADLASGVVAKTQLIDSFDNSVHSERIILTVSVISSVSALWNADSKALAIFIALASVALPFIKLLLSMLAWVVPFRSLQKRERFLEIVDILGKWSFVDIFVLIIIMVAFRSSINISDAVVLEVYIVPKWGFYAFVVANMISLMISQTILYLHRRIQNHPLNDNDPEENDITEEAQEQIASDPQQPRDEAKRTIASQTGISIPLLVVLLVTCLVLHFVGCSVDIYEVNNTRGGEVIVDKYSVFSVGMEIPWTSLEPNDSGFRFIQFVYFLIAAALPAVNIILYGILYLYPMAQPMKEKMFFLTEISFSWAAVEVLVLAVIFSILQIPKFGNGLIQSGCKECNRVDSVLYGEFAILCVSSVMNVCANLYLFLRAHQVVWERRK